MRDSMDLEEEADIGTKHTNLSAGGPPAYNSNRGSINRDASPLPAPVPQKPLPMPRASLERETIFAVGDEDERDSDVSDDDSERHGLTGGKNE